MSLSKHCPHKNHCEKSDTFLCLIQQGVDYCRCFVLCNKRTHHHHISSVSSLPVDVYVQYVYLCIDGGRMVNTTVEASMLYPIRKHHWWCGATFKGCEQPKDSTDRSDCSITNRFTSCVCVLNVSHHVWLQVSMFTFFKDYKWVCLKCHRANARLYSSNNNVYHNAYPIQ